MKDSRFLKAALEHGADPNLEIENAGTFLNFAIMGDDDKENLENFLLLLKYGVDPNYPYD